MTNYFEKCQKCVPPERKPGCQDHCPHYAEAKAKYNADKAKRDEGKQVWQYCMDKAMDNNDGLVKYIKKRPKHKYHR